jgi:hypothetical protein
VVHVVGAVVTDDVDELVDVDAVVHDEETPETLRIRRPTGPAID